MIPYICIVWICKVYANTHGFSQHSEQPKFVFIRCGRRSFRGMDYLWTHLLICLCCIISCCCLRSCCSWRRDCSGSLACSRIVWRWRWSTGLHCSLWFPLTIECCCSTGLCGSLGLWSSLWWSSLGLWGSLAFTGFLCCASSIGLGPCSCFGWSVGP